MHKQTKIVLAFDSFKGSLTSEEVADAFEEGITSVLPECIICKTFIADGGEGTTEALVKALNGDIIETTVSDPLGRPVNAQYGIIGNGDTAIIEMAKASGLTLLSDSERNPMLTSTFGCGELIRNAMSRGCKRILLAIGGSATNDGGTGLLTALGYRFLDSNGSVLKGCGESLSEIRKIDSSLIDSNIKSTEFIVACDVENPLFGLNGAAYVFAPQKGATQEMVKQLDNGLRNYSNILKEHSGIEVASMPGSGAAGGMSAGMTALLGAKITKGIDMVLDACHFENIIRDADYVITGEGKIDRQTLMGKAPAGVLRRAKALGIPTIAVGGAIEWCKELEDSGFHSMHCINEACMPTDKAMFHDTAIENVRRTGKRIGELLYICRK